MCALCFVGPELAQVVIANGAAVDGKSHGETRHKYAKANQLESISRPTPPLIANGDSTYYSSNEYPDCSEPEEVVTNAVSPANRPDNFFLSHPSLGSDLRIGGCLFGFLRSGEGIQFGSEPSAYLGPWDGLSLTGIQSLDSRGNLSFPGCLYILVHGFIESIEKRSGKSSAGFNRKRKSLLQKIDNLFGHGVILTHRVSIRSPAMKNRNAMETKPFMVKKAAFTRLRSSCFTRECS
jgi:hypothetical protein